MSIKKKIAAGNKKFLKCNPNSLTRSLISLIRIFNENVMRSLQNLCILPVNSEEVATLPISSVRKNENAK